MTLSGTYIAKLDLAAPHHSGVAKKIEAQVQALRGALGPVTQASLDGLSVMRDGQAIHRAGAGPLARRWLHMAGFYRALSRAGIGGDYVYIRYQRSSPAFIAFLKSLKRENPRRPVLVEIPTYPYEAEQHGPRDRLLGRTDRMYRGRMKGLVDRIVTFSDAPEIFGIPTIRTENGVLTEAIPVPGPVPPEPPLVLVAVANLGLRHAYDRVIAGLAGYRTAGGTRALRFDIIGSGVVEGDLRTAAQDHGVQDIVRFLGPRTGADLDRHMARAHIGISALGMHRIRTDTTDIKSREYCARGLPFVIANPDRDFDPGFPFAHHAPVDDSPIDIAAMLGWWDRLRKEQPDYPAQLRSFAETNLGWRAKMAPVIGDIREMAASR